MKKLLVISLTLLVLALLLAACTENTGKTESTAGNTEVEATVGATEPAETEEPATQPEETQPALEETAEVTEAPETEPETVDLVGVRLDHKRITNTIMGKNQTDVVREEDATEGTVIKLTTTHAGTDPYITLNYSNYARISDGDQVKLEDYPFIIIKIKNENCPLAAFNFYWVSNEAPNLPENFSGHSAGIFNNASTEWQYIWVDMSFHTNWKGLLQQLRLDWQDTTGASIAKDVSMSISGVYFAKTEEEAKAIAGLTNDPSEIETDPEIENKVDELLATKDPSPEVSNDKLTAEHEDANLNLWFNHSHTKTPAEDITPTDMNTYKLRLAKNESESCHMLLASLVGHNGVTVSVTNFKNASGAELKTELMYGYYFEDVEGETIPDPTPWVNKSFDLAKDRSQMFIIKVTTGLDSQEGLYEAEVSVKDADGKEIKKAKVYTYVWDFTLPEETSCKTQMDLSWYNIYVTHDCPGGDDGLLYKNYYDLLLANRICAYTLPYSEEGYFTDSRILEYLDNPRVVAFNPLGWTVKPNADNLTAAYNFLSQKEEWLDKSYFYLVDEPLNQDQLDSINDYGDLLKEYFPGYKMMAPEHENSVWDENSTVDSFEYVKDSINVWCFKPFFYTTFAEYNYDHSLTYKHTPMVEANLGTFAERMAIQKGEGDEVWWYVTRRPESPEITLLMETESVRHRILFWQQKLYNVDSFLYYLVNDWYDFEMFSDTKNGVNKKYESVAGSHDCYGNGVLVYCGQEFDVYGGVGSLRLENVRDGIEDFEYLTMMVEQYDKETVDAIIRRLTTSLADYNTDEEFFAELRVALGNALEAAMAD